MLAGGKPKPAALKLLNGNPGEHRIQEEVKPPDGEIKRPKFVKGKAGRLWAPVRAFTRGEGRTDGWDADMFGTWCCLMAEFQKAPDQVQCSETDADADVGRGVLSDPARPFPILTEE